MKFLGKKEGEDLSLYLFNAELIRTESWWEDKEGDRITEEPDEWPDEYDLEIEEEDDMVDFKEIEHLISADYPRYYCWESDDTAYHKKRKLYRIKEGNVI